MKRISATLPGRVLALLLTLCLLFTAGAVTAFADEEEYPYLYPEEKNYDELSFYVFYVTKGQEEANPPENNVAGTYRLLDQENNVKLAYCADAETYDNAGFCYRQIPLSDKFSEDAVKHLRAIINNSYPFVTVFKFVWEMKADDVDLHSDTIPYYRMALISAVQQAIYKYTNTGYDTIYKRFAGALPAAEYAHYESMIFKYEDYSDDEEAIEYAYDNIDADVNAVFTWLTTLDPEEEPSVPIDVRFNALIDTVGDNYKLTLYDLSEDVKSGVDLSVTVKSEEEEVFTDSVTVSNDKIEVKFPSEEIAPGDEVTVELTVGKQYQDVVAYESEIKTEGHYQDSQLFIGQGQLTKYDSADCQVKIPEKVRVSVEKDWDDSNNKDGIRPASVTVHLLADGKDTDKTLTMDASNDWKGTFEDLDATVGGVNINYTVKEDPVTGYDSVVEGSMTDGFKITNTSRGAISIRPADITIYMGGEEGYDAVVGTGNELLDTNNSLPLPLFHIEAPTGVKPENLTFISSDVIPGTGIPKKWSVSVAGETREGKTLYYLNKENDAQDDVRIQYTNNDSAITSDQFDPNEVKDLYLDYTAKLYTGTVNVGGVRAVDTTDNKDYGLRLGEGTLRVRAVEDGSGTPDTNPVYPVQNEEPATKLPANTAAVVAEQGTKYRLNHTTVKVEAKGVGLLFDDIYDKDNGQGQREKTLIACSDKAIGPAASNVIRYHQAKYLDLVDQNNGNAWVQTMDGKSVKVVWAYPEGTDKNTKFTLLHFEGLHRDDADDASSGYETTDIEKVTPENVNITNTDAGITFEVSSGGFSPFVLIWEKAKPAPEKEEESTTPAATPKPTPAPAKEAEPAAAPAVTTVAIPQTGDDSQPLVWVALVVLSGAALAGLAVYRKKRSDK